MTDLLNALRVGTRSMHTDLHRHPSMEKIAAGVLTLQEYRHMLLAFYSPWKQIAPAVDLLDAPPLQQCLLARTSRLREDLLALGVALGNEKASCSPLTKSELWGSTYVMVGASLGATQLSKQIAVILPNAPLAYFSMTPSEAGWPLLKDHLVQMNAALYGEAIVAAQNTFRAIGHQLSAPLELL